MPRDKAMQLANYMTHLHVKEMRREPVNANLVIRIPSVIELAEIIDTALAEASLEGARAMQAGTASELVNQHASAEIDGYQAAATVDALDPQQVINESVK
jgi:hypothetical protein